MNIFITLDYELFLNDITGDVDSCLVTPTDMLLKVLDKHDVKATFYIDSAYLYRLHELMNDTDAISLAKDYDKVLGNVREIVKRGHTIGLHIHPQWFYSTFDGDRWIMDFDNYKLSDMPIELADKRFRECYELLKEISGTEISSFRAGGYSIQGYSNYYKLMKSCGIRKDSSVLYKMKNQSHLHYFDYTGLKNSDVYSFEDNITSPVATGAFEEYPISTDKIPYLKYCRLRLQARKIAENKNWGNGGNLPGKTRSSFLKNIVKKAKWSIPMSATIDYQSFVFFGHIFNSYLKKNKKDFVIIGHPKNFSPASLNMLDIFIESLKNDHCFKTI